MNILSQSFLDRYVNQANYIILADVFKEREDLKITEEPELSLFRHLIKVNPSNEYKFYRGGYNPRIGIFLDNVHILSLMFNSGGEGVSVYDSQKKEDIGCFFVANKKELQEWFAKLGFIWE